jgi:carbon storage regulator
MLVVSRRVGETIQIGPDIEVMLTRVKDGVARIAIKAPESVVIVRGELAKKEPRDERDPSLA